jgi:hypothetical protein
MTRRLRRLLTRLDRHAGRREGRTNRLSGLLVSSWRPVSRRLYRGELRAEAAYEADVRRELELEFEADDRAFAEYLATTPPERVADDDARANARAAAMLARSRREREMRAARESSRLVATAAAAAEPAELDTTTRPREHGARRSGASRRASSGPAGREPSEPEPPRRRHPTAARADA